MSSTDVFHPPAARGGGRRGAVRVSGLGGIDGIEVSDDGLTLTLTFLGKAPEHLRPGNIRIDGGVRITGIGVREVRIEREDDPELDDRALVILDAEGDTSVYTLSLVERGPHGRPGEQPLHDFDPRYASAQFSFRPACPADTDCLPVPDADPVAPTAGPIIDYTAKDYDTLLRMLLDRMSATVPGWVERHAPDLELTLVELLAYAGDQLSYYQDAVGTEAYLDTARRRISVRRHVRLIDYPMHDGMNARTVVFVEVGEPAELAEGTFRFTALDLDSLDPRERPAFGVVVDDGDLTRLPRSVTNEVFEPLEPACTVRLRPAHNTIRFWTWGESRWTIPLGATSATMVDDELRLKLGDLLLIEEVIGPRTGAAADADPAHRQVVRISSLTPGRDDLYRQPVVEVGWAVQDALTFAVTVATVGGPDCEPLCDVSVARGNLIAVDHGRSLGFGGDPAEWHDLPPAPVVATGCDDCGCGGTCCEPDQAEPVIHAVQPLDQWPVTQAVPYPDPATVAGSQAQLLDALPGRVRAELERLWRHAERTGDAPPPEAVAALSTVFGPLDERALNRHPARVLRDLLTGFDTRLAVKLARRQRLADRARAGTVLGSDVRWELHRAWGTAFTAGLDADDPARFGPAAALFGADPRAALPVVAVDAVDQDAAAGTWTPRRDLLGLGPRDRFVVGETDDDGRLVLRFGDGVAGMPPPPGGRLAARYRVGNGTAGNVGADAINHLVLTGDGLGAGPAVCAVRNPLPAVGGTDPETVDETRQLAPLALHRVRLRAITADDYAELASALPGVQRAAADLRWTGAGTEVAVAVDPLGAGSASPGLLAAVAGALEPYRRIGHDLAVQPALYVPLEIELTGCVDSGYEQGHVLSALLAVLGPGRLPDGRLGFFHPDALSFGDPVRVSRLVAVGSAVPGVVDLQVTGLRRQFAPDDDGLADGVLRIGPLEVAQCDNRTDQPEHGRLTISLGGGR
jgi:predicted phage baseplate assembly protein